MFLYKIIAPMFKILTLVVLVSIISLNNVFGQVLDYTDNSPVETFINEEFCFTDEFTNSGATGYGPYVRIETPPEITLNSVDFLGSSVTINDLGVYAGVAIADPILTGVDGNPTGTALDSITGTVGNHIYVVQFPVGSVVDGGPDFEVQYCYTIDLSATIGVAQNIAIEPAYYLGDAATGVNGPLFMPIVTESVVPIAFLFTKISDNFEDETTPGSCTPIEYTLNVNIANGITLSNLEISDVLPPELQFVSIISNSGCTETTLPSAVTPGGNLLITCPTVTGGLIPNDVTIVYDSYVIDILDETICDLHELKNAASASTTGHPVQLAADTSDVQHV